MIHKNDNFSYLYENGKKTCNKVVKDCKIEPKRHYGLVGVY